MRKSLLIIALVLAASMAHAAEIDNAVSVMSGMEASFTQRFTPKGFTNSQVESGSVIFGTLPMMRWTYTKPEEKVFVSDGSQSWFYVPADKPATVATLDHRRKSELPLLLIGESPARDPPFARKAARR